MNGLEDDPRKFQRPYKYDVTKDISDKKLKAKHCCCCGEIIVGKEWRVNENDVKCTRCHNE